MHFHKDCLPYTFTAAFYFYIFKKFTYFHQNNEQLNWSFLYYSCVLGETKGYDKDCTGYCASGSMNYGFVQVSYSCCDTDLCNVHDAPGTYY